MKKNKLILGVSAALLLSSTLVMAEEEFPAADFQPKVLFADENANNKAVKNQPVAKAASTTITASTKQQASATPENIDSDDEGDDTDSTMLYGLLALAAAGGFLLFKKHVASLPCPNSQASESHTKTVDQIFSKDTSGLSGVARYLKNKELLSASGVERYLAKQEAAKMSSPVTGVAKYLKNKG